jgi:hypothetical protein
MPTCCFVRDAKVLVSVAANQLSVAAISARSAYKHPPTDATPTASSAKSKAWPALRLLMLMLRAAR